MPTLTVLVDGTVPTAANFNDNMSAINDQIDGTSGTINTGFGTASEPSHSFSGDGDTGFYRSAENTFDITTGGARVQTFPTTASAVNYFRYQPAVAGSAPTIDTQGTDTNIALAISTKGTGTMRFLSGAAALQVLTLPNTASAVNEYTLSSAVTGAGPIIAPTGDDTNIGITLDPKGTGSVTLINNTGIVSTAVSGTPAANAVYRENVTKAWVKCGVTGNILDSFNVTSVTDTATGQASVAWDTDFTTTGYAVLARPQSSANAFATCVDNTTPPTASAALIDSFNLNVTLTDPAAYNVIAIGEQ